MTTSSITFTQGEANRDIIRPPAMESWSLGYDGNEDVERHAGVEGHAPAAVAPIRLRVVSDYI